MNDFTAVITGGNKGIGADLAQEMKRQGWTVVSIARGRSGAAGIEEVEADLSDPLAVAEAAAAIAGRHQVTHLVNNAGIILPNLLEEATVTDMQVLTQLHLGAPLQLLQAFLPAMKQRRFGRILFNGSRAGLGAKTRTAYSASKAGIVGMARTWALELAPHGITVNVVASGPVLTDNFWGIIPKGSEAEADLARRLPVGRLGSPADITRAFMFFAADDAGFITGQTLYVCGGASIGAVPI